MNQINVQEVENGFIVYELGPKNAPAPSLAPSSNRMWAFESAKSVGDFVVKWGNGTYDDSKTGGG